MAKPVSFTRQNPYLCHGVLYYLNQFVSHASRAFQNRRNVTIVTVIFGK
jgi:hypothetical protein